MGGFLAGAPENASVAGICNMSAQCEWAAKDWAAPGSSHGQETASFPSVPGRKIVIFHANAGVAAFVCDLVPLCLESGTACMLLRWRPAQNMATEFLGLSFIDAEATMHHLISL